MHLPFQTDFVLQLAEISRNEALFDLFKSEKLNKDSDYRT